MAMPGVGKAVSLASLLGMIDHRQNQQLPFVKACFLLPRFISPFPCLLLTEIPASNLLRNALEGDQASGLPSGPTQCTSLDPRRWPPEFWCFLQAGLGLKHRAMVPLLLVFKHKLGSWAQAKSPGEGRGQWTWQR